MFLVSGHDNDISFFEDQPGVSRCETCNVLLAKWTEDLAVARLPRRLKLDVSTSYDGVDVVSLRFRQVYESARLTGLRFIPLSSGIFAVRATDVVIFDTVRRGTRFIDQCERCGQFASVVGATPPFLLPESSVSPLGFARSDLEFGSHDERSPLLFCGDAAANVLSAAKLTGLDLERLSETAAGAGIR